MTNYIIKKNAQRLINYINLIEQAKHLIERQKLDLNKWDANCFGGLHEHYQKTYKHKFRNNRIFAEQNKQYFKQFK